LGATKNPKALLSALLVVMLRPSSLSVKMLRLPLREVLDTDHVAAAAAKEAADINAVLCTQLKQYKQKDSISGSIETFDGCQAVGHTTPC
jgi:hypothetical protein